MSRRYRTNGKFSKPIIFILIQFAIMLLAFIVHILNHNIIVNFFSLLLLFTIISFAMLEMIMCGIFFVITRQVIKDKLLGVLTVLLFLLILCLMISYTYKYYEDIPHVLISDYTSVEGECTMVFTDYGRGTDLHVTVNNEEFIVSLSYRDSIKKGGIYEILYMPHTKQVVNIYEK